ncbi:uncharacterized protein LOC134206627 [Armigeres subalbatus]|uniref:uncharacterized protein LOC134206627 n=1 Tax=Armigeres subalbatus TaxID=124917 RepID=UPI002ECFB381
MTDCGTARYFLGIRIDYNKKNGIMKLSQEAAATKMLDKFGLSNCNPTHTPMEKGLQLTHDGNRTSHPYRELLGSIMYQMLCVGPDLCYPVNYMGRYQQNPTESHWTSLKQVTRYLKGTTTMALIIKKGESSILLEGYVDADWAIDVEDRMSVTEFSFKVYGCSVLWARRKQATVSTSSSEAEYVALSAAVFVQVVDETDE